jgi:hypothetical protein
VGETSNKPPQDPIEAELEKMQRETDEIVEKSASLIREMEELLESGRQLRAAQAALLDRRRKKKLL